MEAFRVEGQSPNAIICSGHNAANRDVAATVPDWPSDANYAYAGMIRVGGLDSRAGVSLYYQDTNDHYQVNIQSGECDPT